jgi:hypothetical protein
MGGRGSRNLPPLCIAWLLKNAPGEESGGSFPLESLWKGVDSMPARRESPDETPKSRRPPATTPEGRENQLIAAAVDLAEEQIRAGTASAQVISHYLKLGSSREKLEQERIRIENDLSRAKIEHIESMQRQEDLMLEALKAMRGYKGEEALDSDEDDDEA